jgi:hypothetical protein
VFDLSQADHVAVVAGRIPAHRSRGPAIDRYNDGLSDPEQYTVALIATRRDTFDATGSAVAGSVLVFDISTPSSPTLLTRIETPGILRDLDVDVAKRRVFATGESDTIRPGVALGTRAVYMLDLSRLGHALDADGDGVDDRVLWKQVLEANSVRVDAARGLVAVGTDKGMDLWAVYDTCCDLGVDTVAAPTREITADRGSLLGKERDALQIGIKQGLAAATTTCGTADVKMSAGQRRVPVKADPPRPAATTTSRGSRPRLRSDVRLGHPSATQG